MKIYESNQPAENCAQLKIEWKKVIVNHINRRREDKLLKNLLSIEVVAEIDRKMRRNSLYLQYDFVCSS